MGFSYLDAQSDKLAHVSDVAGGQTTFAYDGAGKLQRVTDARGRSTNVTVSGLGDLTSFQEPDLETYRFTYAEHRMTQKQAPRGDATTYTFRADGTVQTLTKPGGQVTTVDAVLSHPPTYDAATKTYHHTGEEVDPASGKQMKSRDVLQIVSPDEQMLRMYRTPPGGAEFKMMEIRYTRKKSKAG